MNAKTSESIRRAFQIYAEAELRALDALSGEGFEPSSRYEARMTLVRRGYEGRCRAIKLRKAVALVACAVLVIMSITACVYREEIKSFLVEIFDDHVHYEIWETDSKLIETYYFPTYIPEGYVLDERSDTDDRMVNIFYTKGIYFISYHQSVKSNYSGNLDTEGAEYDIITVGGQQIHRIYKNNTYSMLWETERYVFGLTCHDSIGWEEIEQIILSIKADDELN